MSPLFAFGRRFGVMSSTAALCLALLVCARCAELPEDCPAPLSREVALAQWRSQWNSSLSAAVVLNDSNASLAPVNETETAAPFMPLAEPVQVATEPKVVVAEPVQVATEPEVVVADPVQVATEPKVVVAEPVLSSMPPVKTVPLPEQVQPQVVVAEPENSTAPASKTQEVGTGERSIELVVAVLLVLGLTVSQLWSAAIKTCNWARDRMSSAPPQDSTVRLWKTRYGFNDWNCRQMREALYFFVLGHDREVDALFTDILRAMDGVDAFHQALFVANCARTYGTKLDFESCDFYQVMREYYPTYTTREYTGSASHFKSNFLRDRYTLLRSQLSIPSQKEFSARNQRFSNEDSRRWRESRRS